MLTLYDQHVQVEYNIRLVRSSTNLRLKRQHKHSDVSSASAMEASQAITVHSSHLRCKQIPRSWNKRRDSDWYLVLARASHRFNARTNGGKSCHVIRHCLSHKTARSPGWFSRWPLENYFLAKIFDLRTTCYKYFTWD